MSGIILGPGLIGEAASKKAQATAVDDAGGGAIQLGPGLASKKIFGKAREAAKAAAASAAASVAVAPIAPIPAAPVVVNVPTVAPGIGLSEDDIEIMLAADANAWDLVAEAEGRRVEGWRPRVARMLLVAAPEAKAKPVPPEIVVELERIAEIGLVADAEKLRAVVGATEAVGTGDPGVAAETAAPPTTRRALR